MNINSLRSIFFILIIPIVMSCTTMTYEEKFTHDYLKGPKATNWPFFKNGSETWVGAIRKRDEMIEKVDGNLSSKIFFGIPKHLLIPLDIERVEDDTRVAVEIKFSELETKATYWVSNRSDSEDIQCEVMLTNKNYHSDKKYVEFDQPENDCTGERLIRMVRRDNGLLHVSFFDNQKNLSVADGMLNLNKYKEENVRDYMNATKYVMNNLQKEYGPRNVYVDRTGKPATTDYLSYSYDALCRVAYLTLKYEDNDILRFVNETRVHPNCVVDGKTLTKHALENKKYKNFNYLVLAGGSLSKKDINGQSVSFELGSHQINEDEVLSFGDQGIREGANYRTLRGSGSFIVEDYLAGVRDSITRISANQDWGSDELNDLYVKNKEDIIGRYERALIRKQRATGQQ